FILVLLVAFLLFKQVKQIRKANKTIENQKNQIEAKQKETMDSIYYARRIQNSLLASDKYIGRTLNRLQRSKDKI
ncbi:MAG TPA: hypothetical protein VNZ49_10765, partial [Bacteroidia bacterium]|nr:hypothetical protein [Bacteroidia bacterium]